MTCQVLSTTTPKARKAHPCWWCREDIEPGTTYQRTAQVFDGELQTFAQHLECADAFRRWIKTTDPSGYDACDGYDPHDEETPTRGSWKGEA